MVLIIAETTKKPHCVPTSNFNYFCQLSKQLRCVM